MLLGSTFNVQRETEFRVQGSEVRVQRSGFRGLVLIILSRNFLLWTLNQDFFPLGPGPLNKLGTGFGLSFHLLATCSFREYLPSNMRKAGNSVHISALSDIRLGFLHFLPVGTVIFGYALVFGVLAVNSGLSTAEACFMSLTVFAGASQFIALPMMREGATIWALTAMALVVNLRHLLYGLNIGKKYSDAGTLRLMGISLGIVDETYAFNTIGPGALINSIPYFAGTALCSYAVWNLGTLLGALAGQWTASLNTNGLDFAMLAVFISMVGSSVRRGADWFVVGLSIITSLLVFKTAGGYWHIFAAGLLVPLGALAVFREAARES